MTSHILLRPWFRQLPDCFFHLLRIDNTPLVSVPVLDALSTRLRLHTRHGRRRRGDSHPDITAVMSGWEQQQHSGFPDRFLG
jgi:hypothetical protein